MFVLDQFIRQRITRRESSLFAADMQRFHGALLQAVQGRSVCVIGGAGTIGSAFIKTLLPFGPRSLHVIDLNENGLAELTRDLRSTPGMTMPKEYHTYAIDYAHPLFERMLRERQGFEIVANFSAHKHVRSEKDAYAVQAMIENNDLKLQPLLELLCSFPPERFFCVSTDKAANPVNVMGASKRVMEELMMGYADRFNVTAARFANVAFSNGSLPDGWLHRLLRGQPLVAPADVRRYFVSPEEAGQICLIACMLGRSGEILFPKLETGQMLRFSEICDDFIADHGLEKRLCADEAEARSVAASMPAGCKDYPVVYSRSDTTGEKMYEEFYIPEEQVDWNRFQALGVIVSSPRKSLAETEAFLERLKRLFATSFTKGEVVAALKSFVPHFTHEELGRTLDDKM